MFRETPSLIMPHAAFVVVFMLVSSLAAAELEAGNKALAGQMCPGGSFVIGFDSEGDIVCSEPGGNGAVNTGEIAAASAAAAATPEAPAAPGEDKRVVPAGTKASTKEKTKKSKKEG